MIGDAVTIKANSIVKANCRRILAILKKLEVCDSGKSTRCEM